MQSLVLATSLLLSSQSPVIVTDIEESLSEFVQKELSRVTQYVQYKEQVAAQDTFLYQAKLVINQAKLVINPAKRERASALTIDLAAE